MEAGPLNYEVRVYPPTSVKNNPNANVTLHFEIEKVSLQGLSSAWDRLFVDNRAMDTAHMIYNTTPVAFSYRTSLSRYDVIYKQYIPVDVMKLNQDQMPGFRYTWHYSGREVEPDARFRTNTGTKAFIRNNIPKLKVIQKEIFTV